MPVNINGGSGIDTIVVEGTPIPPYCDAPRLTLRANRLRILDTVMESNTQLIANNTALADETEAGPRQA